MIKLVKSLTRAFNQFMNEYEKELEHIELMLDDPTVVAIVQKVKEFNDYLREVSLSENDAETVLQDINKEWSEAGLKGKTMRISGDAWAVSASYNAVCTDVLKSESYSHFIERKADVGGFAFVDSTQITEDGVLVDQNIYLNTKILIDDDQGVENKSFVDFVVALNERTHIRYEGDSPERAENWLEMQHSDIKAQIVEACVETEDEAQAVMALRDFSVPIQGLDKKAVKELKKNLEIFTRASLELERWVPYLFESRGTIKVFAADDTGNKSYIRTEILTDRKGILNIQEEAVLYEKSDDKQTLQPVLFASIVSGNRKDLTICKIPFSELFSFESVRSIIQERIDIEKKKNT